MARRRRSDPLPRAARGGTYKATHSHWPRTFGSTEEVEVLAVQHCNHNCEGPLILSVTTI